LAPPPKPPADAPVGINAVVATKAVAAKQQITDLGNMASLLLPDQFPPNRRFYWKYARRLMSPSVIANTHETTRLALGTLAAIRCGKQQSSRTM
jgi:hypothetical protein